MTQEPFVIIPIWVMDRLKGNPTAFLLYTLILMHNNESKGYAWPSQVRLAELMGCTKITVLRNLKFLEETGGDCGDQELEWPQEERQPVPHISDQGRQR